MGSCVTVLRCGGDVGELAHHGGVHAPRVHAQHRHALQVVGALARACYETVASTTAARTKAVMPSRMMAVVALVGFGVTERTECLDLGPSPGHGWRALLCHRMRWPETGCSLRVRPCAGDGRRTADRIFDERNMMTRQLFQKYRQENLDKLLRYPTF